MMGLMELTLFYITLLEIFILVIGADHETTNSLYGNLANPHQISITKEQTLYGTNFQQTPTNFAPKTELENEHLARNARQACDAGSKMADSNILNSPTLIENTCPKANRHVRQTIKRDSLFGANILNPVAPVGNADEFDIKNLNQFNEVGEINSREIRDLEPVLDSNNELLLASNELTPTNLALTINADQENIYRNVRDVSDLSPLIKLNVSNQLINTLNDMKVSSNSFEGEKSLGIDSRRNSRDLSEVSMENSKNLDISTNDVSNLVERNEILKENVVRNAREVMIPSLMESNVFNQGVIDSKEEVDYENNLRGIREPLSDMFLTNDHRSLRDVTNEGGKIDSDIPLQLPLNSYDGVKNIEIDNRVVREITNTDNEMNLREISNEAGQLETNAPLKSSLNNGNQLKITDYNSPVMLNNNVRLEENNPRYAREVDGSNFVESTTFCKNVDSKVEEVRRDLRSVPNISVSSAIEKSMNSEVDVAGNGIRNARDTSDEGSRLEKNSDDIESDLRVVRDISGESKILKLDVPKQGIVVEQRSVREVADSTRPFVPNISNQEAITGQSRNARQVYNEGKLGSNVYDGEKIVAEPRNVREVSSGVSQTFGSSVDTSGEKVSGENEEGNRQERSCRKKLTHHKNCSTDSDDKFVYEKPKPLQASLEMMNIRIVKSKDDTKFLDDVTDNGNNEGETGGVRKSKKKSNRICRVKHLHVLQPLKKNGKIVDSARKKHNLKNSTGLQSGERIGKVLEATLDGEVGGGGSGGDNEDETDVEDESEVRDEEEADGTKNNSKKPTRKPKSRIRDDDRNYVKAYKDASNRLVNRIVSSSSLVAENIPKRVFGGSKKFVLAENRHPSFISKNRKSLFKKEHRLLGVDDPTFLVGVDKNSKNKIEVEDLGCAEDELENSDSDDGFSSGKTDENYATIRSLVLGIPENSERLKLKDLQNVSEASNNSDNRQNVDKSERQEMAVDENEEEEGEEEEEDESEDEGRGRLEKRRRYGESGEDENEGLEFEDKFVEKVDVDEKQIDENVQIYSK